MPLQARHMQFLSTLSLRRATVKLFRQNYECFISIHALLAESDGGSGVGSWRLVIFLSTLSLRRATMQKKKSTRQIKHFYPRSPCGERRWLRCWQLAARDISIHALLAESDNYHLQPTNKTHHFYPRSPCGERRDEKIQNARTCLFLSTLSLRRATFEIGITTIDSLNFYPRSPCGERPTDMSKRLIEFRFLSTLSLRRATYLVRGRRPNLRISIHALLAESDNPTQQRETKTNEFLSTLSLRRATIISQHSEPDSGNFYPRSPCGERRE